MVRMVISDENQYNDHQHGSIVRIKLENFMTYDSVEVMPGPRLNMILGPNGTGKSTIVCCIIVGLAGDVNLTHRGSSPADYVKKNTNQGRTEIELCNTRGENFIIERRIIITGKSANKIEHKSEWKINSRAVTKAQVQDLTKKLNIKVDNLCQFLPQDSVTQFVKMNTCELLQNTLKAAGDTELVDDHVKLIDISKEIVLKRNGLKDLEKSCKENEINAQRLETEVAHLKEKDKLKKMMRTCDQKIYWAKYQEGKTNWEKAKEDKNQVLEELKQVESTSEPYKKDVDLYKTEEARYKQSIENSGNESSTLMKSITHNQNCIEESKLQCQEEFSKFTSRQEEERNRESTLRLKHQELKNLQDRLDERREADYTDEIIVADRKIADLKKKRLSCIEDKSVVEDKLTKLIRDMEDVKSQNQLIQEIKQRKAGILRIKSPDSYKIMDWLSMNTDKFEKQVFLPMMCEINVKDPKFNSIIENSIQNNELTAFVCQSERDVKLLTRLVREELKLKINVILAPEKTLEQFNREAAQLKFGNHIQKHFLRDLIDCPEPILRYLCGNNNFHRVFVVENCNESVVQELIRNYPRFYANGEFFSSTRSRYDDQLLTVRDFVRNAQFLVYSWDNQKAREQKQLHDRLQAEIREKRKEKDATIAKEDHLRSEWQRAVEEHRKLKDKQDEKRKLEQQIKLVKDNLKRLDNDKIDIELEREKLQSSIESINMRIVSRLEKLSSLYSDLVAFKKVHMTNLILIKVAERNHKIARRRYQKSIRDSERLKEKLKKANSDLSTFKAAMENLRSEAEEKIPCLKDGDGKLDSKTKREFNQIDETSVEDLTTKREDLKIRIQRIYTDKTNSVISEYNRQNDELKDKKIRIEELTQLIRRLEKNRETIKQTWLPKLNEVIDCIDESYSKFMRRLKYDGQVKLDFKLDDIDDFSSYGIMILVKYRDTDQLVPLSSTRQSGGERSVATMIYMLALQNKTTAPFRCVDEINQGMDKDNERKVFELLVETADSSSSQYFLVSPKLLPNLPYSDKMKIHIIFNGPKMHLNWADVLRTI